MTDDNNKTPLQESQAKTKREKQSPQANHQAKPKPQESENPPIKVKQYFDIPVLAWRHPLRVISWLATLVFLFPDLSYYGFQWTFGMSETMADLTTFIVTFMLFFGLPLGEYFIEYRQFPILLYEDRVEFRENIFLKENHRIRYDQIVSANVTQSYLQKIRRLKSLRLTLKSASKLARTPEMTHDLHDLKNAHGVAEYIFSRR